MVVGSMTVQTDVVVIGAGPGGYVAALRAAQLGLDVMIVEKSKKLGGVCLNEGCIPTKALIVASNYVNVLKELDLMGITIEKYQVQSMKMNDWKQSVTDRLEEGIQQLCKKNGVEVIEGKAIFTDDHTVRIEGKSDVNKIEFKNAIVATGSSPIQIPNFEFDGEKIITSTEALQVGEVPKKLIIIGGGYIGTEMATVYGKLGCEVHILEATNRLVSVVDEDIVAVMAKKIVDFNVTVHLNTKALGVEKTDSGVIVKVEENMKEATIEADKVLVCVGRKPNSKGFGLEDIGVTLTDHGFVQTNQKLQTSIPHIYAVGDCIGQPMLAHKASREAKVAAEVIAGLPSAMDNKVIPSVVFNDPEIASVGMNKQQAIDAGYDVIVGSFPFKASGRAMTLNQKDGFIKIISDKKTKLVLGVHGVGPDVSNVISEAALLIEMAGTVDDLALTIHPHPTISESLVEAADNILHQLEKGIKK
ncbi:MAG: dihydrolipoamide dehydrogenase [Candidatus Woesearchaeota archaeon]|jgi:dihydrolipoamide dehydrogenase